MEVFDVPFVFPSYEKIDQAIDGGMGRTLADELAEKHVKVVYWADYGFVQFANNKKPIQKPQDFEGLKIRGYSEIASETIKALGRIARDHGFLQKSIWLCSVAPLMDKVPARAPCGTAKSTKWPSISP